MSVVRSKVSIVSVLVAGCLLITAAAWGDGPKTDLDLLQGTWDAYRAIEDGKDVSLDEDTPGIRFKGNKAFQVKNDKETMPAAVALDSTKTPKEIRLTPDDPAHKAEVMTGIYKIEENLLTLCFSSDNDVPKEFKSDRNHIVFVYRKQATASSKPASLPTTGPAAVNESQKKLLQGSWRAVELLQNGKTISLIGPGANLLDLRFNDNEMLWVSQRRIEDRNTFKLDASKNPLQMDIVSVAQPDSVQRVIYELKGDSLQMCWATDEKLGRPKELKAENGYIVWTFKRLPAASQPASSPASAPASR